MTEFSKLPTFGIQTVDVFVIFSFQDWDLFRFSLFGFRILLLETLRNRKRITHRN